MNPNNNPKAGMDNRILDTDYEILGYADKLSYTEMYRVLFYSLAALHRQSLRFEAIEMFNDCIGDFKPLWDETFFLNYQSINKTYSNAVDRYRLHRAELISLIQRAGLMDLPDLRYNAVPDWVVPKSIEDLNIPPDQEGDIMIDYSDSHPHPYQEYPDPDPDQDLDQEYPDPDPDQDPDQDPHPDQPERDSNQNSLLQKKFDMDKIVSQTL